MKKTQSKHLSKKWFKEAWKQECQREADYISIYPRVFNVQTKIIDVIKDIELARIFNKGVE